MHSQMPARGVAAETAAPLVPGARARFFRLARFLAALGRVPASAARDQSAIAGDRGASRHGFVSESMASSSEVMSDGRALQILADCVSPGATGTCRVNPPSPLRSAFSR